MVFGRPTTVIAGFAFAALITSAHAGDIVTTDALFAPGDAPETGQVIFEPDAAAAVSPRVPTPPPLGSIGGFSADMPTFPGVGMASGSFRFTQDANVRGGTYRVDELAVAEGVVVTLDDTTTILCDGAVDLRGSLVAQRGDVRVVCTADFSMRSGARIDARSGAVRIDAGGSIALSENALLRGDRGGVTLRAHGLGDATGAAELRDVTLTGTGDFTLQAIGTIRLGGATRLSGVSSNFLIQSFGGDVEFVDDAAFQATSAEDLRLEAAGAVRLQGSAAIQSTGGNVRVRALGGPLEMSGDASIALNGSIDLGSSGDLRLADQARLSRATTITLRSFGGSVELAPSFAAEPVRATTGVITIAALENVQISGGAFIGHTSGATRLIAHGGSVLVAGLDRIGGTDSTLTIWSAEACRVTDTGVDADDVRIYSGGTVTVATRDELGAGWDVDATVEIVASDSLSVTGEIRSGGPLQLVSLGGDVTATGARLETTSRLGPNATSGSIALVTFNGAAVIDVSRAVLTTGRATLRSGDIVLRARDGVVARARTSLVAVDQVRARRRPNRPLEDTLTIRGYLDGVPFPTSTVQVGAPLAFDATFFVGDVELLLHFVANRRGDFVARAQGLGVVARIRPDRRGSSRSAFRLRRRASLGNVLDVSGTSRFTVGVQTSAWTEYSTVPITNGRFARRDSGSGIAGGALIPNKITIGLRGKRRLSLDAALPALGDAPNLPADVRVALGDLFVADVPGAAFVAASDGRHIADAPALGIDAIEVDYGRGTIRVLARGLSPPGFGDRTDRSAGVPATLSIRIGALDETRDIRLALDRKRLRY